MRFIELAAVSGDLESPCLLDVHDIAKAEVIGTKLASGDGRVIRVVLKHASHDATYIRFKEYERLKSALLDCR